MADKKITALTERTTAILGTDLLMIVGNIATTPANYKVQVKNFLSQLQVDIPATATAALKTTANVVANSTAIQSVAEFRLNSGNAAIGGTKSYGVVVNHTVAVIGSPAVHPPVAFFGVLDNPGSGGAKTTYLFDFGVGGTANVSADVAAPNSSVILTVANTTVATANSIPATHMLRFRVNNQDMWLLASNVAPA